MNKTPVILFVSLTTLMACAQQQPAESPQASTGTMNQSNSEGYAQAYQASSSPGATEPMPSAAPTSTTTAPSASSEPTTAAAHGESSASSTNVVQPAGQPGASSQVMTSWSDGQILQMIHAADDGEIAQARLARTRATDNRVKKFAAMMIKDHTHANDEARSVAQRTGDTFEPSPACQNLEAEVRTNTDSLTGRTGADFDRAYMQTQINEHQSLLSTIDNDLMPHAQSPDVKSLLTKVRSTVMMHLQHAKEAYAALNGDSSGR